MTSFRKNKWFALALAAAIASVGAAVIAVAAQPGDKPTSFREEFLSLYYGQIVLEYASPATAEDLGLPFYPGAKLERSWRYLAKEKDGRPAGYLAQAFLVTPEEPEKVAAFYKAKKGLKETTDLSDALKSALTGERLLFGELDGHALTVTIEREQKTSRTKITLSRAGPSKTPWSPGQEEQGPGKSILL